jgi:hypothetical protein
MPKTVGEEVKPFELRSFIKETIAEYSKTLPQKAFLIITLQYDDAKPVNDFISAGKYNEAIKYMAQWDYGGENEHTTYDMPYGTDSKTIKKGPYVLVWNPRLDDTVTLYRTARGKAGKVQETVKKSELKEVIKQTLKIIIKEMISKNKLTGPYTVYVKSGQYAGKTLFASKDENTGVFYYFHPDTGTDIPLGTEPNSVQVQKSKMEEMTTTGDVAPINLPGSKMPGTGKSGWVSGKGGSARGVAGSAALGYELTPIGKQDMKRKQDRVYE